MPLVSYLGCDIELVLVVWFIAVTLITASYAGAMANIVDIAPNFAGPVLAFAQTIHMTASFLSPLANFHMLDEKEHLMSAWRTVFYVCCFVACVTYVAYQFWGTGDVSVLINDWCVSELGGFRSNPGITRFLTRKESPRKARN